MPPTLACRLAREMCRAPSPSLSLMRATCNHRGHFLYEGFACVLKSSKSIPCVFPMPSAPTGTTHRSIFSTAAPLRGLRGLPPWWHRLPLRRQRRRPGMLYKRCLCVTKAAARPRLPLRCSLPMRDSLRLLFMLEVTLCERCLCNRCGMCVLGAAGTWSVPLTSAARQPSRDRWPPLAPVQDRPIVPTNKARELRASPARSHAGWQTTCRAATTGQPCGNTTWRQHTANT